VKEKLLVSQIAISFLQTAQQTSTEIAKKLEPFDLSAQQLKILSIVAKSDEEKVTVNDIKAEMFDPMSNVSRLLNKLMDKKLIIKIRDEEDQRLVFIQITKEGTTALIEGKNAMDEAMSSFENLTQEELITLSTLIQKIKS